MMEQYGEEKGRQVYHAWLNKMGYDDNKPMPCMQKKKASLGSATYNHALRTFNNEIFATISLVVGTILGAFLGKKGRGEGVGEIQTFKNFSNSRRTVQTKCVFKLSTQQILSAFLFPTTEESQGSMDTSQWKTAGNG